MIDENLPTFFLKNNQQNVQLSTIYHGQHGNEPEPAYNLRYLDPNVPTSRNRYGVALYDPYVPDVVFGEVAVIPEWTQPSLSAETIRANGGAPPPPEPILPTEFAIQLYNPDQQIIVKHQPKAWNKPARWEFEMPQRTFRVPSASTLDRTQNDPAVADVTPRLRFSWRKDGKLSKDLSCVLHGKSTTIPDSRAKTREPDITVALLQSLRELTLYEPNLYRVEMEDFKGLEVVLLLAAVAIRDIFFGPAKEAFHIVPGASPISSGPQQQATSPAKHSPQGQTPPQAFGAAVSRKPFPPHLAIPQTQSPAPQARRRQDQLAQEEERRTQELLAAERKAQEETRHKRRQEIDEETKRLQKIYGQEEQQARLQKPNPASLTRPNLPPRPNGSTRPYSYHPQSQAFSQLPTQPSQQPPWHTRPQYAQGASVPTFANSPYLHTSTVDPRAQSTTQLMQTRPVSTVGFYPSPTSSGGLAPGQQPSPQRLQPKKSSFFGFLRSKEESSERTRLDKKRSSMF
ncbi:hypothetical protein N7462_010589 [Penicillium macrosclerotiorum]|uniref:uncharacterized protein n=1 Tax=Penicillium macrosclerotiorum TaxID=303699 RepID=UPI0025477499|nr:uncharacterized protein N7462_010589 [Penicillium macrosclerotiorum]KAJ5669519.1 hypothetical protein N7462_010589 [Penicillium macrosclerotiorum]